MKPNDIHVNNEFMFCIGKTEDGEFYISIPVSNPRVDYDEYYEIDETVANLYPSNLEGVREIAKKCRRRMFDAYLIEKPGAYRGEPFWPDNE